MATAAKLGYGSLLKRGNGSSPQTFSTIAEVTGVSAFGVQRELVEVTNFDSPSSYREYIAGLKDGIQFTFDVNWIPTNATQSISSGLQADVENGTLRDFKLQLTSGFGTYNFSGIVLGWQFNDTPAAAITGTFTVKVSGTITWQNLP